MPPIRVKQISSTNKVTAKYNNKTGILSTHLVKGRVKIFKSDCGEKYITSSLMNETVYIDRIEIETNNSYYIYEKIKEN